MNNELKSLIEDAAKLLGLEGRATDYGFIYKVEHVACVFNPLNPERNDLMKVWLAFPECTMGNGFIDIEGLGVWEYKRGDYQSLALAVLRAASAALKERGE